MLRILALDDDETALRYLTSVLRDDHDVSAVTSGEQAIHELGRRTFDLVLADLSMPAPDGFDVLRSAQRVSPPPPVVVITALDSARATLEAMRLGARDYLLKPADPAEILAAVARVAAERGADGAEGEENYGLLGRSTRIRAVRRLIPLLAASREAVLILGDTGSGKELLARALHEQGPRRTGPFVAHNMAATPSELAESLFFGHVRGAFSGAATDHAGLFEQADRGTLFMDEVDSFPLPLQAKLLRVLETSSVQRVGSGADRPVDVRVLAASARDLSELVARDAFRADLYYRLCQLEVVMPTLRDRVEDIPSLARHFLAELPDQAETRRDISPAAMELLTASSWPGNCRELRNAMRSAALLAGKGPILPGHLPRALHAASPQAAASGTPNELRRVEREHILEVLEKADGNRSKAARLLGIDRGTLARKLRALGLDDKHKP